MKSQSTSCLKLLKSIKAALVLECKDIEKKLVSEKTVISEKKNLAVYQAPKYRNETNPRKQYIVKLGEIDWDNDIYGFDNKFIYETPTDPLDFDKNDEDDSMYGVAADFYAELIETLSVDVCEIWNEPEIISITDINGNPLKKSETNATPINKKKNLAVYQAPKYRNETSPRKEYIIKLDKDIDWGEDVYGFTPKFIYVTPTDPYDFDDDDDTIYGVSRDFYDELIEVLSTSVEEIWNEPEILSIEKLDESTMVTEIEKTIASIKFIDDEYPTGGKHIKTYRVTFADELGIWEPDQNMNELTVDLTTNVRPITVEDFGDIDTDSVEFGFDTCEYYDGKQWHKDATFNESFYNALCDGLIEELGYKGEDPKVKSIELLKK
jgi:hypothetical protein